MMMDDPGMEDTTVHGATLKDDVGRITFVGLPNRPGVAAQIFEELAARRVAVDDIIQNVTHHGQAVTVSFTVDGKNVPAGQAVSELVAERFTNVAIEIDLQLARLSVVGVGMRSHGSVAARTFKALAAENINIENISTSDTAMSVLLQHSDAERALDAVHRAFGLDQDETAS